MTKINNASKAGKAGRAVAARKPRAKPAAVVIDAGIADEMALLAASLAADGVDVPAVLAAVEAVEPAAVEAVEPAAVEAVEPAAVEAVEPAGIVGRIASAAAADYSERAAAAAQAGVNVSARSITTPAHHARVLRSFDGISDKAAALIAAASVTPERFDAFARNVDVHGKAATRATFMALTGENRRESAMTHIVAKALQAVADAGDNVTFSNAELASFAPVNGSRFNSSAKRMFAFLTDAKLIGSAAVSISAADAGIQAMIEAGRASGLIRKAGVKA